MDKTTFGNAHEPSALHECPPGFNYTEHNCNKPSRTKRGRYCGQYTLVGFKDGSYEHHRLHCKSYSCARCGPRKIRLARKRIAKHALEHGLQRFLTLTLDPKKLPPGLDVSQKIQYLYGVWRKMRVYLTRKLGKALVFISVVELQRNGNPHFHMLVGSYLPKQWIATVWQALGGGCAVRIEYADIHRVAAYLAKYLTEDSLCDLPTGTRRFSTSRGLALFARSESEGIWIMSKATIESWWEHAGEITKVDCVSESDGGDHLVSFVARRVSDFLACRFDTANRVTGGLPGTSLEPQSVEQRVWARLEADPDSMTQTVGEPRCP